MAGGGAGSQNSPALHPSIPPSSRRHSIYPCLVHSPPPQKESGGGRVGGSRGRGGRGGERVFDCVCCIMRPGELTKIPSTHPPTHPIPFSLRRHPPAGRSQCSLSVLSYDQLATAGQINTSRPLASAAPLPRNRALCPVWIVP